MIIDALATFADAQTGTVSAASTDVVDTVAKGQSYAGDFFVARVDTAFAAAAGAPTLIFQLQTSDTEDFSGASPATLAASSAFLAAALTAGKMWKIRIPASGVKRYLRAYKVVDSAAQTAWASGKWDAFVTPDIDVTVNERYTL